MFSKSSFTNLSSSQTRSNQQTPNKSRSSSLRSGKQNLSPDQSQSDSDAVSLKEHIAAVDVLAEPIRQLNIILQDLIDFKVRWFLDWRF